MENICRKELKNALHMGERTTCDFYCKVKGDNIRCIGKSCYIWDENMKLWNESTGSILIDISNMICNAYRHEIDKYNRKGRNDKVKELSKDLSRFSSHRNVEQVFKYVREILACRNSDFVNEVNQKANLIPIRNGKVLELDTGTVRDRVKEDYFTFECNVDYLPEKNKLKHAQKFFTEIMNGNKDDTKYLQKCLGYCMTGESDGRCFLIFWGEGANGKSSLVELINMCMGKFFQPISKSVLINTGKISSSAEPEKLKLIGARVAVFSETEKGEKLNEANIKQMTGKDTMTARGLYKDPINFKPVAKPIMMTNHKPIFNVDDTAILDRIKYIPFNARFVDDPKKGQFKKDVDFIESLSKKYLDEVFTWIARGAKMWYEDKTLNPTENITRQTNEYISELDTVTQFLEASCKICESSRVPRAQLFEEFANYCKENSLPIMRRPDFFKSILSKGHNFSVKKIRGTYYISGIKLQDEDDDDDDDEPTPTKENTDYTKRVDNIFTKTSPAKKAKTKKKANEKQKRDILDVLDDLI